VIPGACHPFLFYYRFLSGLIVLFAFGFLSFFFEHDPESPILRDSWVEFWAIDINVLQFLKKDLTAEHFFCIYHPHS